MTHASFRIPDKPTLIRRLSNALILLGLLACLIGAALQYLLYFEGYLYVTRGHSEDTLVREAASGEGLRSAWSKYQRVADLADAPLRLGEAAEAVYPAGRYEVLKLPFRLRLDAVEVLEASEPRYRLVTRDHAAADADSAPVEIGERIALAGQRWEVASIRPWMGLMHHAGGPPMANVSLRLGDRYWEDIFLHDAAWLLGNGPTALRFTWFDSEEAAVQALPETMPGPETGRWGVREGRGVHWIQSFLPGNGVTLNDGTEVTLLDFAPQFEAAPDATHDAAADHTDYIGPAILVQLTKGPAALRQLYTTRGLLHTESNAAATSREVDAAPELYLEYPAAYPNLFYLHAWRDGAAWVQAFHRQADGRVQQHRAYLEESGATSAATMSWDNDNVLRLEQVLAQALPVDLQEDALFEMVLIREAEDAVRRIRLREGAWQRVDATTYARLQLVQKAARSIQDFTAYTPGEDQQFHLRLEPEQAIQYHGWRITQAAQTEDAADAALLKVTRRPSGPLWIQGGLLLAIGFLVRGCLWYRKRVETSAPSSL